MIWMLSKHQKLKKKKQFKRSPFESLRVGVEAQMAKRERDSLAHRAFSPLTCFGHTTTLTIKHTKTCMQRRNNVVREAKPCWSGATLLLPWMHALRAPVPFIVLALFFNNFPSWSQRGFFFYVTLAMFAKIFWVSWRTLVFLSDPGPITVYACQSLTD